MVSLAAIEHGILNVIKIYNITSAAAGNKKNKHERP
jgi:hypothetical protein